jgi:hypothetical protein
MVSIRTIAALPRITRYFEHPSNAHVVAAAQDGPRGITLNARHVYFTSFLDNAIVRVAK